MKHLGILDLLFKSFSINKIKCNRDFRQYGFGSLVSVELSIFGENQTLCRSICIEKGGTYALLFP